MPAGPDETDNHPVGAGTEHVMKDGGPNTDNKPGGKGDKVEFIYHQAHPGPAVPKDFDAKEEGTKEEREAKTKELNK